MNIQIHKTIIEARMFERDFSWPSKRNILAVVDCIMATITKHESFPNNWETTINVENDLGRKKYTKDEFINHHIDDGAISRLEILFSNPSELHEMYMVITASTTFGLKVYCDANDYTEAQVVDLLNLVTDAIIEKWPAKVNSAVKQTENNNPQQTGTAESQKIPWYKNILFWTIAGVIITALAILINYFK